MTILFFLHKKTWLTKGFDFKDVCNEGLAQQRIYQMVYLTQDTMTRAKDLAL